MDFARQLGELGQFLDARGHPWALVGALALAAYGIARATVDLDLLTEAEAQEAVIEFLEGRGYETLYRSRGYSNHDHPDPADIRHLLALPELFPPPPRRRSTSQGWEPFEL